MYYDNDKSELIKSCKSKQISDFVKDTETGTVLVPTFRDIADTDIDSSNQNDSHAFDPCHMSWFIGSSQVSQDPD